VLARVARWFVFNPKIPIWLNLGGFAMVNLGIFMTTWAILRPLEIFYVHLVHLVVIWYIFLRFGMLYQEKSGNPGVNLSKRFN
jgi:hypothetical protein